MIKFKKFLMVVLGILLSYPVFASEIETLVKKLMEKGVLTPGEAQLIMTETKEEMRVKLAKAEVETLPKWIQMMEFKGDMRWRTQWEKEGKDERIRHRIRFRLAGEISALHNLKVGFRLASGGADPRSTMQTLENTFETKPIMLDYIYGEWIANKMFTFLGGKFPCRRFLWTPADLLWDGDITMEGVAVKCSYKIGPTDIGLNIGGFVLDEIRRRPEDPMMMVIQPEAKVLLGKPGSLRLALAYYGFEHVKGANVRRTGAERFLPHWREGNTLEGELLKYDYDSIGLGFELDFKEVLFEKLSFFGEFINNFEPKEDNIGYLIGVKFGAKKVEKFGQWQVRIMHRSLQKDAWLGTFPDSDAYGGGTNVEGQEVSLVYGLGKNVDFTIDYSNMDRIKNKGENTRWPVLQFDVNIKF